MSKSSVSIIVYSTYLGTAGLGMALAPNFMLRTLGLPETDEPWIRLFGALAVVLGAKGYNGALLNLIPVMRFDIYTRACFSVFLTALILYGAAPRILFVFAAIDFAAAVWTVLSIRSDTRGPALA